MAGPTADEQPPHGTHVPNPAQTGTTGVAGPVTTAPTEADLESRIDASIRLAFPFLPREAIKHQTKFSFWFGTKEITIDDSSRSSAQSRSDIILNFRDDPLAVLELKRPDQPLAEEDLKQGLSYARALPKMPPLVVVSNGKDVRCIQTYSGQAWEPKEGTEAALAQQIASSARAAKNDLKEAVSTLMGTNPAVWVQAVKKTTNRILSSLTGPLEDRRAAFVSNFTIPREATKELRQSLEQGNNLILIEGAPLSGKSHVLRELALASEADENLAVFYVESDGPKDMLQVIADLLSDELAWPVSADEARTWLRQLAKSGGPKLVLAIDGISVNFAQSRQQIVDLTSDGFVPGLAVVIAIDDTIADSILLNESRRGPSTIGKKAKRIQIQPLSDEEFVAAAERLWRERMEFTNGAHQSPEYRSPWILRAIASALAAKPGHAKLNLIAKISPLMSLDLIEYAREKFDDAELKDDFQHIAEAILSDIEDHKRPVSFRLEAMVTYMVRKRTLGQRVDDAAIKEFRRKGYLKLSTHESGETVLVARLPELVAAELATAVAKELSVKSAASIEKAAAWLTRIASELPLGDIIAAQALIDAAVIDNGLPLDVLYALMERPPHKEELKPGSQMAVYIPAHGTVHLTVKPGGFTARKAGGAAQFVRLDEDDGRQFVYSDIHPWIILSHFAGMPFVCVEETGSKPPRRVDPGLLIEVAKCPMPLRKPGADMEMNAVCTHDIEGYGSIVCHGIGIIEPITFALYKFLAQAGPNASEWVKEAVATDSLALLGRLDIALLELTELADDDVAKFARDTLRELVHPKFLLRIEVHAKGLANFPNPEPK